MTLDERFWAKVDRRGPDECWPWVGSTGPSGYGHLYLGGGRSGAKFTTAQRVAYQLTQGPIPEGLEIDHLCRNPICVNPAHLEAVTPAVNVQRIFSRSERCRNGAHIKAEVGVEQRFWAGRWQTHCRGCRAERHARKAACWKEAA